MKKIHIIGLAGLIYAAGIVSAVEIPFIINPTLDSSTIGTNLFSDPEVTITTNVSGNDLVYSFSYENVDLDGGGLANDTLSWDMRWELFESSTAPGGQISLGIDALGAIDSAFTGWEASSDGFWNRDTLKFSIENVSVTADEGYAATFAGFNRIWLTAGTYYIGEGADTAQHITAANGNLSFDPQDALLITAWGNERNRSLVGSFTVEYSEPPVVAGGIDWIGGGSDTEFTTINNWSSGDVPGSVPGRIDTAMFLQPTDAAVHGVDYIAGNFFDVLIRDGASLGIEASLRIIRNFNIGNSGETSADVSQSSGVVVIRDQMNVGTVSDFVYDAKYSISGGTVRITNSASTGVTVSENGIFEVIGNSANIDLDTSAIDFSLSDGGELRYVLGSAAVSSIDVGDVFSIGAGSLLTINATSYAGGEGTMTLANFVSSSGSFEEANITITGLDEDLAANITYDATSMFLNVTLNPELPRGITRVFLLGGQSNMNGLAPAADVQPPYDAVQSGVAFWEKNSWVDLEPGYGTREEHIGPELSFGYALKQALPIDQIYLIKFAVNGSNLYDQWKPGDEVTNAGAGVWHDLFMTTANAALANLDANGVDYEISGMLWLQGESDAADAKGALYETNLRDFIADMRTRFGAPNLPFYMGRVRDYYGTTAQSGMVRDAQVAVADSTADVEWFDTDSYNPLILGGHYDTAGQIGIGIDYANLYLATGPTGTFGGWANEQGLDGSQGKESGFSDDPDQDGVENALEWVSGGIPLMAGDGVQTSVQMDPSNSVFSFSFNREEDSIGRVDLAVEWITELGSEWTNSIEVIETPSGSYSKTNGIIVTIDDAPHPDRVTVSAPESLSEDGQLFFRLKVSQP
jgi:hypothetical protein